MKSGGFIKVSRLEIGGNHRSVFPLVLLQAARSEESSCMERSTESPSLPRCGVSTVLRFMRSLAIEESGLLALAIAATSSMESSTFRKTV
jgi:hypothetical protein